MPAEIQNPTTIMQNHLSLLVISDSDKRSFEPLWWGGGEFGAEGDGDRSEGVSGVGDTAGVGPDGDGKGTFGVAAGDGAKGARAGVGVGTNGDAGIGEGDGNHDDDGTYGVGIGAKVGAGVRFVGDGNGDSTRGAGAGAWCGAQEGTGVGVTGRGPTTLMSTFCPASQWPGRLQMKKKWLGLLAVKESLPVA